MKKTLAVTALSFALLGCSEDAPKSTSSTQSSSQTEEEVNPNFYIVDCSGTAYENGKAHGAQLKEQVAAQLEAWQQAMHSNLGLTLDSMRSIAYEHTGFVSAIQAHTPELLEEINGIADGAEVDRDLVLVFNLGEEIYSFCNRPIESCSNIAGQNDTEVLLSYNQDLPDFLHGDNRPVVLKHDNYCAFAFPGSIGISGVSSTVAVSCNSLPMLNMNEAGIPLSFAVRRILQEQSLPAALYFLDSIPLAIPQNLLLTTHNQIIDLELSRNEITEYKTTRNNKLIAHTNHPLVNNDSKYSTSTPYQCNRFDYLDSTIASFDNTINYSIEQLEEIMSLAPVTNQETYLRFTAVFNKGEQKLKSLVLINPRRDNSHLNLSL